MGGRGLGGGAGKGRGVTGRAGLGNPYTRVVV